jgi:hypothetical protein
MATRLSVLVIVSLVAGCQSPHSRTSLGADSAIVPTTTSLGPGDTTFIEERRYEEAGVRTPDGKCRPKPGGITLVAGAPRRIESRRMTQIDQNRCLFLVITGYRKSFPAEVEAPLGTGGISAGAAYPPPGTGAQPPR